MIQYKKYNFAHNEDNFDAIYDFLLRYILFRKRAATKDLCKKLEKGEITAVSLQWHL